MEINKINQLNFKLKLKASLKLLSCHSSESLKKISKFESISLISNTSYILTLAETGSRSFFPSPLKWTGGLFWLNVPSHVLSRVKFSSQDMSCQERSRQEILLDPKFYGPKKFGIFGPNILYLDTKNDIRFEPTYYESYINENGEVSGNTLYYSMVSSCPYQKTWLLFRWCIFKL